MSTFLSAERPFSTRPLLVSWIVPIALSSIGGLTLLAFPGRTDVLVVCGLFLVAGVASASLVLASRIRVADGQLMVRYRSLRAVRLRLVDVQTVSTRRGRFSQAPALVIGARDGTQASMWLGTWRCEEDLLAILAQAADRARASVDAEAEVILRDRPSASVWRMQAAGRPRTTLGRWFSRLPDPVRWVALLVLYWIAVSAFAIGLAHAGRISETVLFPRRVDSAWSAPVGIVSKADTWVGNVAVVGDRTVLATRENVDGFWGTIRTRSSVDGGATWSDPVSLSGGTDAARHTLIAASDGSLFAAWSKRGPKPVTQRLVLRRSLDGGASWAPETVIAIPAGGTVGIPALVMNGSVRLMAYTDGTTGQIWTQPLDRAGSADGPPTSIDVATRDLYSDAAFIDASLAVVAVGRRAVLAYVHGDREVRTAVSDDSGRTWKRTEINQDLFSGRPRLATDGSTVVLAVSDPNGGARSVHSPFIRIWRSVDAGITWNRGPDVTDVAGLGSIDLTWSGGEWQLLYDACPGVFGCATDPRIWYANSPDAVAWSEPEVVSDSGQVTAIGVVAHGARVSVIWGTMHSAHDWDVVVSIREKP